METSLARHNRRLEALYAMSRTVSASLDLREVLRQELEQVLEVFNFPSGVLRLLDAPTGELSAAAHSGHAPAMQTDLSRP